MSRPESTDSPEDVNHHVDVGPTGTAFAESGRPTVIWPTPFHSNTLPGTAVNYGGCRRLNRMCGVRDVRAPTRCVNQGVRAPAAVRHTDVHDGGGAGKGGLGGCDAEWRSVDPSAGPADQSDVRPNPGRRVYLLLRSKVLFLRRLPTSDRLVERARRLGVPLDGLHDSRGVLAEAELQRRVLEASRGRRESWLWLLAVLSARGAIGSATAAGVVAWRATPAPPLVPGPAWVLWVRNQPYGFIATWGIVEAFPTHRGCVEQFNALRDRESQRVLPVRGQYRPEGPRPFLCLPNTVRPDE
jgi:hypothetical protein